MRLALLPASILALIAVGWGGLHTHSASASTLSGVPNNHSALYSLAAQAAITTTTTTTTAASPATTETAAVTSTTVAQSTPVPLPTATSGGNLQLNPLNWTYLTSAAPDGLGAFGPFSWIYLVLMLVLLGGGAYFYFFKRPEWKRTNSVYRRAAERFAPPAMWLAGVTMLFMLFRVIHLDGLNIRLWLYLSLLALIALGIWFYYWYSRRRPTELAKFEKTQRARQYMPAAKKGSTKPAAQKTNNQPRKVENTTATAPTGQSAPKPAASKPTPSTAKRKKRR